MPNKPNGRQSVNYSTGKTSHLLLKRKGNFPDVANPAAPNPGEIIGATCRDDDNDFYFTATVLAQPPNKKRLALRIVSGSPGGGGDPTEGLLTVTIQIATGTPTPDTLPPVDAPVEYISDPGAP
ncbi:MAG: hypothetical protein ACR2FY_00165 [Pirellulaceae bacterium]